MVRRTKPTGGTQLARLVTYDHHAFIFDREGDMWSSKPTIVATPCARR